MTTRELGEVEESPIVVLTLTASDEGSQDGFRLPERFVGF
jgi:hypothetical protein